MFFLENPDRTSLFYWVDKVSVRGIFNYCLDASGNTAVYENFNFARVINITKSNQKMMVSWHCIGTVPRNKFTKDIKDLKP